MEIGGPFRELQLKWTDTNFQSLLDALPDAVLMSNQAAKILVANKQAERILGYTREELIGRTIESLVSPKLRDPHALSLDKYSRDANVLPPEIHLNLFMHRGDGVDVPVEINLKSVAIEAGTFVISAIREATGNFDFRDSMQSETVLREIRESESRSQFTADSAPVMIWMSGTDKLRTYFNEAWLGFTGRSSEQESGNGWASGVHPDDLHRYMNKYRESFDRREEFNTEYRLRRCDEGYRWIFERGEPRFNVDRSFNGYVGSCVEMTWINRVEESLRQKEMDLLESQRLAGVGTWSWHGGNDTVTWSEQLYRIAGRDLKLPAPTYKEHSRLLTAESWDRLNRALGGALSAGIPEELDLEMLRPDGTTRWVRVRGEGQRDNTGRIVRLLGTVQDITDRKQTEKELSGVSGRLLEAQEQERSRIARDLHDDISQRLALLVNDFEALENDLQDSTEETRHRIHAIGSRASEICSDIQDISHQLHSSKLQYLGIAAAAKIFCREFSEHEKLQIAFHSVDIPPNVPDNISLCLFRVLQETLHNAAKHSGASYLEVYLRGKSSEIQLTVRDRGVGFDPDAAMKRNGLGLISIRERVGLVGGTFSILSKPYLGTEISVRVPISAGEKATGAAG